MILVKDSKLENSIHATYITKNIKEVK